MMNSSSPWKKKKVDMRFMWGTSSEFSTSRCCNQKIPNFRYIIKTEKLDGKGASLNVGEKTNITGYGQKGDARAPLENPHVSNRLEGNQPSNNG